MTGSSFRHNTPWRRFKRQLRLSWRAQCGRVIQPGKWVFVVGCYNSGTTLLTQLLSSHPEINVLPREGVELTDVLPRPEQFGWPRMWIHCRDKLTIDASRGSADLAERIKKQWSYHTDGGAVLVEKSPANLLRLPFLQAHFQPASFIYIVRNGYAVAEGIRRKADPRAWGHPDLLQYSIEDCARLWMDADQLITQAAPNLSRLLCLRYEDLVGDTSRTLGAVSDFLGLAPFAANLSDQEWEVHRGRSTIKDMNSASFERLTPKEQIAIQEIAGPVLDKYGYKRD